MVAVEGTLLLAAVDAGLRKEWENVECKEFAGHSHMLSPIDGSHLDQGRRLDLPESCVRRAKLDRMAGYTGEGSCSMQRWWRPVAVEEEGHNCRTTWLLLGCLRRITAR